MTNVRSLNIKHLRFLTSSLNLSNYYLYLKYYIYLHTKRSVL